MLFSDAITIVDGLFDVGPLLRVDLFDIFFLGVIFDLIEDVIDAESDRPFGDELGILTVGQRRSGGIFQL